MNMELKAIFFDFDNTLVGTDASTDLAYEQIKETLNCQIETSEPLSYLKRQIFLRASEAIKYYKHTLCSVPNELYKTEEASKIRINLWRDSIRHALGTASKDVSAGDIEALAAELFHTWHGTRLAKLEFLEKGTLDVLHKLRDKYKLVLITNGCSSVQWEKIEHSRIEGYFNYTIVSGDEPHDKPHTSIFLKACRLCGVEPKECAMVGDSINTDIKGANISGLASSVLLCPNPDGLNVSALDATDRPTKVISSITELLQMF